jgi:hypothetical protein
VELVQHLLRGKDFLVERVIKLLQVIMEEVEEAAPQVLDLRELIH